MPRYTGVRARKARGGRTRFYIRLYYEGREVEEVTDAETAKDASHLRAQLQQQIEEGTYVPRKCRTRARPKLVKTDVSQPARLGAAMFREAIRLYRRKCAPRRKNQNWQRWMTNVLEEKWGDMAIPEITVGLVEAWRDELEGRCTPETVRKYILFLHNLWESVRRTGRGALLLPERNPASIDLPRRTVGLKKALTPAQVRALLEAAEPDPYLYRWALLCLRTGMRVEEAQELRWRDVDVMTGLLVIHDSKQGVARRGEAGEYLLPHLREWRKAARGLDERVIGPGPKDARDRWLRLFQAAEIPWGAGPGGFTPRNLRTTFCMHALQHGAQPHELVEQTGHSIETLLKYYAEASREQRQRAVNVIPDWSQNSRYFPGKQLGNVGERRDGESPSR
jgi:integrase